MNNSELVDILKASGEFAEIDWHLARFINGLENGNDPLIGLLAALTSRATREGNICINLEHIADTELLPESDISFRLPSLEKILTTLKTSKHTGQPGQQKPLILDSKNQLYLYRYWHYENILARKIKTLGSEQATDIDYDKLNRNLKALFGVDNSKEFDYQLLAAFSAVYSRFCVITGGPGTGKTTAVVKILALLIEQNPVIKIALTAPTGKAAARLRESIQNSVEYLSCDESIKDSIPREAATLHRLLGSIPNSPYFKHNRDNPLPYDLIVVDEASMVDLAMLAKLAQALNSNTRLILIGDKDQLASVEAGAALGDICSISDTHSPTDNFVSIFNRTTGLNVPESNKQATSSRLSDCIVELKKSYRFGAKSGIGKLSRAVNERDFPGALGTFQDTTYADLTWRNLPPVKSLFESLESCVTQHYSSYLQSDDPRTALAAFSNFQILCAVREGPYGVVALNSLIERILNRANLIDLEGLWYRGRPVIILKNDYQLELYNGDIGITLPDDVNPAELKVYFIAGDNTIRKYSPVRLPAHETVFAMTIHKSQGSEFENVLAVLPDSQSPVLTRELLYTGITRAKSSLEIWCNENILEYTIRHRVVRESGLLDKIIV